ncbi:NAD-dependent protein deacetylase sirtuin-2 [Actinomortierella ambigua]|uniref:NAD-dependent protein deacetylase sirtuin-2 n=1 Tax=Actinomortierella ambigua TaxID=1343610 RepID=A0A9P6QHL5_9FUNG|nr:NAD-dependent protein deacetylase sirtuin-2 [Actinomortierella ambigua]
MSSQGRTSIKAKAKAAMKDKEAPPARVPILSDDSLEAVADFIKQGKAKNIIVMAGAGISTAAGIKDFRSPGTGLYSDLAKYNLPYPEAVFDIDFFKKTPAPFYRLAKELYPGRYRPTLTHYFFRLLVKKNLLLRIYTQNIDSLERQAGIDGNLLVEAHGSFASSKCIQCGIDNIENAFVKKHILKSEIPYCKRCGGLVKPAITFFGEDLPARFGMFRQDFPKCDLLIVLGTSLKVEPFNRLTAKVKDNVPRLLINREKAGEDVYGGFDFDGKWSKKYQRDAFFGGDCDSGVRELAKLLGWETDLDALYADGHAQLKLAEELEALELEAEGQRVFQDEDDETDEDRDDELASQDPVVGKAEAELPTSADTPSTEKVAEAIDLIVSQLQQSSLAQSTTGSDKEETKDHTSDQPTLAKAGPASKPDKKTEDPSSATVAEELSSSATEAAKSSPKSAKDEAKGSCGLAEPESAVECVNALPAPAPAPAFVVVAQIPIPTPASMSTASSSAATSESLASASSQSFAAAYTPLHRSGAHPPSTLTSRAAGSRRVSCPPISPLLFSSSPVSSSSSSRLAHTPVRLDKLPRPQSSVFFNSPLRHLSDTPSTTLSSPAIMAATTASAQPSALFLKPLFTPPASPLVTPLTQARAESQPGAGSGSFIHTRMLAKKGDEGTSKTKEEAEANIHAERASESWPTSTATAVRAPVIKTTAMTTSGTRARTVSSPLTMRPTSSLFSWAAPTSSTISSSSLSSSSSSPSPFPPLLSRSPLSLPVSHSPSPLADTTNVIANQNVAYPSPSPSPSPKLTTGDGGVHIINTTHGSSSSSSITNRLHEDPRQVIAAAGIDGMKGGMRGIMDRAEEGAITITTTRKEKKENHEEGVEVEKTKKMEDWVTSFLAAAGTSTHAMTSNTTASASAPAPATGPTPSATLTVVAAGTHHSEQPSVPSVFIFNTEPKLDRLFTFAATGASGSNTMNNSNNKYSNSGSGMEGSMQQQQQHIMTPTKIEVHKKRLRRHRSDSDRFECRRGAGGTDEGEEEEDDRHRRFTLSTPDGSLHPRQRRVGGRLSRHGSLSLMSSSSSSTPLSSCGPSLRRIKSAFPYLVGGPVHKKRRV